MLDPPEVIANPLFSSLRQLMGDLKPF